MAIKWDQEKMTSGSDEIDNEHKEWIQRFNQFDHALVHKQGTEEISNTLQYFLAYTTNHFPIEEAMMDQYNCPAAAINRAEHSKFREKLQVMSSWIRSEGASLVEVIELKSELEDWLINHICQIDTQLRPIIQYINTQPKTPLLESHEDLPIETDQHKFAEAIIMGSPDVIVVVNEQGQIVFTSPGCRDITGYESKELLGKSIEILIPAQFARHSEMREHYQKNPIVKAMSSRPVLSLLHKSGVQIPVDISLGPMPPITGYGRLVQAVIRNAMPRWNTRHDLVIQSIAMNAAANGIVITDTQGVIQWVNPAVTRMTGYTQNELVGSHTRIFKSGKHDKAFYQNLWQTVLSGKSWSGEFINRRKDGTHYHEEQHIAPVHDEQGEIVRLIAIKQDITARRQAEARLQEVNQELQGQLVEIERLASLLQEANQKLEIKVQERTTALVLSNQALEKANQQLKELDHLKSAFIGVISHELRTPLARTIFSLQLIEGQFSSAMSNEHLQLFNELTENVQNASEMINNLVNYADFVRKQGMLKLKDVNPAEVINVALLTLRRSARIKKIEFKINIETPLIVQADEERLIDAIHELADNAVKYTSEGGTISIRAWLECNKFNISVQDTGMGVPPEKLPNLWESFYQMADPLRRGVEGLGLGLALVKYIVEAHNGQVWAESQVGIGSTFGFSIPAPVQG